MRRPGLLALLALLVALGGCSGAATPGASPTAPPGEDCSLPSTTPIATTSPTPTESGTGQVSGGVTISSYYDEPLSVVLYVEDADRAVLARQYPADTRTIELAEEMVDWRNYRVELRSGCDVLWERPVYSYEHYGLHVLDDGTVEVVEHGEA
jgi:hypothetical protein